MTVGQAFEVAYQAVIRARGQRADSTETITTKAVSGREIQLHNAFPNNILIISCYHLFVCLLAKAQIFSY